MSNCPSHLVNRCLSIQVSRSVSSKALPARQTATMAILTTIFSVFPAVLTVISFAFTTLTTVNRDWAHQSHYTTTDASVWNKSNIAYTVYRSPFYACSPAAHYTNNTPVPANFIGQFNRGIGDALD